MVEQSAAGTQQVAASAVHLSLVQLVVAAAAIKSPVKAPPAQTVCKDGVLMDDNVLHLTGEKHLDALLTRLILPVAHVLHEDWPV